jgi:uncharacterized circularly permuted ATP-grasp superfamily protein
MTSLANATTACARQESLAQRARLLCAIWIDLQGERRVVERNALPARLLGGRVPTTSPLGNYAAHLTLCSDDIWRVTRDDVGRHPAASVLQAPLLAAFLPGICRLLFGQPLLLPSIPVWWLGDAETMRVLAHDGRRFWIRDGLNADASPVGLAEMSASCRASLQSIVSADPSRFIAGREPVWSAPTWRVTYDTAGCAFG